MFEQVKNEVVGALVPDYLKTMYSMKDLASCEAPTLTFVEHLVKLILPDKKITIGEP